MEQLHIIYIFKMSASRPNAWTAMHAWCAELTQDILFNIFSLCASCMCTPLQENVSNTHVYHLHV